MKDNEKFLEFNDRKLYFLAVDGTWWIAIKPICEALDVDYEKQRENLKKGKFLKQLPSTQRVVAADGKLRKMICLPERYIYGWIFRLDSGSPILEKYQLKCCDLLYDYFHGTLTDRHELISQLAREEVTIRNLKQEQYQTELDKRIQEHEKNCREIKKKLARQDNEFKSTQIELFSTDNTSSPPAHRKAEI